MRAEPVLRVTSDTCWPVRIDPSAARAGVRGQANATEGEGGTLALSNLSGFDSDADDTQHTGSARVATHVLGDSFVVVVTIDGGGG